MAVITSRTGARSWATATDWVGDACPVDNVDSAVIAADCQMLMNQDQSAYTGLLSVTINGGAAPGILYFKDGTSGYLKLKTGCNLDGTTSTNRGRLLANSDGVWRGVKGTTVTGSAAADTLTAVSHGLADTTLISFFPDSTADVLPAPLVVGKNYFVRDAAADTFKVALTSGGAAIDLTTNGTGTFGVNTCLAQANKAVIDLQGTSRVITTNLDIVLCCTNPANLYVTTYKTAYTCTDQTTDINVGTDVITFTSAPPAAGTAVIVRSSGTLPTPLSADYIYYIRTVSGNTCKLATQNSDATIVDITATGSGTLTMYNGHTDTGTKTINVIEDVTADPCWVTTTGHNRVCLVDIAPESYDQQRDTLATINAGSMVITTNNIDSVQYPGARIYLSSRNVSIRSNGTSANQNIVDYSGAITLPGVFQCEIANVYQPGTQTTFYGYGINKGTSHIMSGSIFGCNYGAGFGVGHIISGSIFGCNYGAGFGVGYIISGKVGYNASDIAVPNTYDFQFGVSWSNALSIILKNAKIPSVPTFYRRNTARIGSQGRQGVFSYDHGQVAGAFKCYQPMGDIVKTACDGTGDAPSVDPDAGHGYCIEASNIQSNCGSYAPVSVFDKHKIWFAAGTYTITYKVQTTYAGITAGNLKLTARYLSDDSPLTYAEETNAPSIAQRANDADWTQTLAVTITTLAAGWVELKMELMEYEAGNKLYVWPTPVVS